MTIDYTITIGDIINALILLLTFAGLIFAGLQIRQTERINRANLVKELYFQLNHDPKLCDFDNTVEWSDYQDLNLINLHDPNSIHKAFAVLSFFEIICSMYYSGVLKNDDMKIFHYKMNRVYAHPSVQRYLTFLENFQNSQNIGKSLVNYKKYCQSINSNHD